MENQAMDHLVGQNLGRYKILSLLGEGGMGAVFKGWDETLKRDVAIKVMSPQLARQTNFQERFLQEARTVARLSHPNVVQIYDFGQEENQLYIVMEFISGKSLQQYLQELRAEGKWLELPEAVQLVRQVLLALDYGHKHGVLHRDLKPDNIMLKAEAVEDLSYRPVITDLGLAKLAGGDVETQVGTAMGTPAYMSPEQALGLTAQVTSDIYSSGILLYELATGRLPFEVKTLVEAVKAHGQQTPPAPRALKPEIPEVLEKVILKAIEKEPPKRFQDAAAMAAALENVLPPKPTQIGSAPVAASGGGTQFQEMGDQGRGASIMGEFSAPVMGAVGYSGQEQIQILTEFGKQSFVPVQAGGILRVGREEDNEIMLKDAQASRHHARIEYDGKVYKVIDLNSRNGTFLEDAKLLPGVPETWPADKALRIGKTYLRLVRPQEAEKTAVVSAAELKAEKGAAAQPDGRISVLLDHDQISVEPGKMVNASLTLLNQGIVVDHFSIAVQGIPTAWIPSQPPVVQLMPGAQQVVNLVISPPRLPTSRAGTYPITFRVTSRDAADRVGEVKATLTVGAFHQFTSELHPQKVRAGRIARLRVENQGNIQEIFNLLWLDRAAELDFKPPQMQLKVSEGKESFAEFRAVPRSRALLGGEKTHAFTAEVGVATAGEPQVHNGEVISRALIPLWVIPLLMLLCLCLLAAAGLGYATLRQNRATETAQATAILASADPDQDGLTNSQELALGSDPNNPDTDGDGLSDGREINETGTDPKNKDTDGDTLLDGAEVDQIGTSPNNKDTDGDGITDNADANPLSLPTATPIPTITPTPTPPPYKACPDSFPSRLHIGDHATVSEDPPVANNLRNNPGTEGTEIIGKIDPGEEVEILDGPQCQNNWVWWKVKVLKTSQVGWTSEGDGTTYWLVPKP
jgi:eukaryotic-like serine/threonine-protein kinase